MGTTLPFIVLGVLVVAGLLLNLFGRSGLAERGLRARRDRYAQRMVEPRRPGPGRPR